MKHDSDEYRSFIEAKREAGKQIDPRTAEFLWTYALTMDSYGVIEDMSEEMRQAGREYFLRAPDSDWIDVGDLPEAANKEFWQLMDRGHYDRPGEPPPVFRIPLTPREERK
jgi:hypothetical protein